MSLPPAYTVNILAAPGIVPGVSPPAAFPPAGYIWVMTDVTCRIVNDSGSSNCSLQMGYVLTSPWLVFQCCPYTKRNYHWRGRQVISDLLGLLVVFDAAGDATEADLAVTGFQLAVA